MREKKAAAVSAAASAYVDQLYLKYADGYMIYNHNPLAPSSRTVAGANATTHSFGSIAFGDIEMFAYIEAANFVPVQRIFIIGNGCGYSTFVHAYLFSGASIDVIDIGFKGADVFLALTDHVASADDEAMFGDI